MKLPGEGFVHRLSAGQVDQLVRDAITGEEEAEMGHWLRHLGIRRIDADLVTGRIRIYEGEDTGHPAREFMQGPEWARNYGGLRTRTAWLALIRAAMRLVEYLP